MCTQDAGAHAMDGGHPRLIDLESLLCQATRTQLSLDTRLQLTCRLVREGDGAHALDSVDCAAFDGMDNALGQGECLPRTSARRHDQGPIERIDAFLLPWRQRHLLLHSKRDEK